MLWFVLAAFFSKIFTLFPPLLFFDHNPVFVQLIGTALLSVKTIILLSGLALSRLHKVYTLHCLWPLRIKMCCQVTEASREHLHCLCCTDVSISTTPQRGGWRGSQEGAVLWDTCTVERAAAMHVLPTGESMGREEEWRGADRAEGVYPFTHAPRVLQS